MKKYYKLAIEHNNVYAMYNLGRYYQFIEVNYELMKKYYELAIDKYNDSDSIQNLDYYNSQMTM
jgi:hypothetical protein